ncbi:hypothetical protein ACOMCU_01690 [Lysinibacillus sp. UGB7]|uniref:hypothetical protein n=1 Tax=Lysinibacillus sp. UGB7 TaxID=3411039 RepID=UPI003B7DE98D
MPLKNALYQPSKRRHQRKLEKLEIVEELMKSNRTQREIAEALEASVNYAAYLQRELKDHHRNVEVVEHVRTLLQQQFSFEEILSATGIKPLKMKLLFICYDIEKGLFDDEVTVSTVIYASKGKNSMEEIKSVAKELNVHFSTILNIRKLVELEDAMNDWDIEKETVFEYDKKIELEQPFMLSKMEQLFMESLIVRLIKDNNCGYKKIQKIFALNNTDAQEIVYYCLRNEDVEISRSWRYPNELVARIYEDYEKGMSNQEIEDKYNLTKNQFKGMRSYYDFPHRPNVSQSP